ncbi:MAG TPA: tagaturonate epimerase family protein [Ktedonobacterales bacterium]|nr:tagaturonate epimerase family protein [Ktedonobacterales bacterium]
MSSVFPFAPAELQTAIGAAFIPDSLVIYDDAAFWYEATSAGGRLAVLAGADHPALARFHGESQEFKQGYHLKYCPPDGKNSQALRASLPWLQPTPLGLDASAGFGDRLGLATAGHVHVLRRVLSESPDKTLRPIFAQQSMRENERTHRTPEEVLNDATCGAFQAGWRDRVGADADHLKTTADVDVCAAAGYSFYTIDPGAFVDSAADEADPASIQQKVEALPWSLLESSPADLARRYIGKTVDLETQQITLDEAAVLRAAAKYSRAVLHVVTLYRHLAGKHIPFELEPSVDETETPTTPAEHIFIASELRRLGVQWVSMAPRYVGRFEKGIDYIGDLATLRRDLQTHAEIARALGPYKLSLHSGSDKFSVYALISEAARGMTHLKTAGTSYVEALRVVAQFNAALFRNLLAFACERYPTDRASYHVSAEVNRVPDMRAVPDAALPALLDDLNARQILHVTYGSVLAQFGAPLRETLQAHLEAYNVILDQHFYRHLRPFVESTRT